MENYAERLLIERAQHHAKQIAISPFLNVVAGFVFLGINSSTLTLPSAGIWIGLLGGIVYAEALLARRLQSQEEPSPAWVKSWFWKIRALLIVDGMLWIAGTLIFPTETLSVEYLGSILLLLGLLAGSISALGADQITYLGFAVTLGLGVSVEFILMDNSTGWSLFVALVILVFFMGSAARNIGQFIKRTTQLQFEKEDLITQLAAEIESEKFLRKALLKLSTTDPLTGTANRRLFSEFAKKEFDRSIRYQHSLSLIYLDIDHFKRVNDTHGHEAGDVVLKTFAQILKDEIRETDIFARLGGEEFAILLVETGPKEAIRIAERFRKMVEALHVHLSSGKTLNITCCFGIASLASDDASFESLMRRADAALYRAKDGGRNQVASPPPRGADLVQTLPALLSAQSAGRQL